MITSNHEHYVFHRKNRQNRLPNEDNPVICCACGCGTNFNRFDSAGRPRKFISGHNMLRGVANG